MTLLKKTWKCKNVWP